MAADGWENAYDAIGMAEFDFDNQSLALWLGNPSEGFRFSWSIFGLGTIGGDSGGFTFHEDGSFSVIYHGIGNFEGRCMDWRERSPDCGLTPYYVTTKGRSNLDRSRIVLTMEWTNCLDEQMDTGTIEMWKEW